MSRTIALFMLPALCVCALTVFNCSDKGSGIKLEVIGFVVDSTDRTPLAGVLASVTGTDRSITTDSAGRFTLERPPREQFFMFFTKDHYKGQIIFLNLIGAEGTNPTDTVFLPRDTSTWAGTD